MPRRRLRIVSSSDEEDDPEEIITLDQQQQPEENLEIQVSQHESPCIPETEILNPNPNPNSSIPYEISDDDDDDAEFIDVPEEFSPPVVSDCPIEDALWKLGLRLRREWLASCIGALERSVSGYGNFDVETKAKLCFEQFLHSDMNYVGAGVLPENVGSLHLVDLPGPYVLQVDEIVNISCPLKSRYQEASAGLKRCLKLSMTDGIQRVFGMEYRPIRDLQVLAPAGLKVAICNVYIRHGILMLVPEVIEVLGGSVDELDAARQRLVHEVNKPPRGKRSRDGPVPSLAARATLAAWPQNGGEVTLNNSNFRSQDAISSEVEEQGVRLAASSIDASDRIPEELSAPAGQGNAEQNPSANSVPVIEEFHMVDLTDNPITLTRDPEVPFTYLFTLSTKWAAEKNERTSVQGKIKCFLTGVKGFQFKQRATFELRVYVDDGSLISEIAVDHNVVQKGIGHSPQEVTAALTSSDTKVVSNMKETLKQFQSFLANFEGTVLVEINDTSPIPIALEMNQGCPSSDAWLLLKRLKSAPALMPQYYPSSYAMDGEFWSDSPSSRGGIHNDFPCFFVDVEDNTMTALTSSSEN
ncbi:RecQ mediated genome instability protein 1, N-terminal [Dillenia turbinata]|uniref:RecQ-mediated genome instability protein 1 n=1 Tax=Dillenia turbinata TaxID=194707 RepID=A0AAN8V496_9MAGN